MCGKKARPPRRNNKRWKILMSDLQRTDCHVELTFASMNGCNICSFHQNCFVTLRQSGSVAWGSSKTSQWSSPAELDSPAACSLESDAALRRILDISCCFCCREVVMSIYQIYASQLLHTSSYNHLPALRTCPTAVVSTQCTLVLILQNIL